MLHPLLSILAPRRSAAGQASRRFGSSPSANLPLLVAAGMAIGCAGGGGEDSWITDTGDASADQGATEVPPSSGSDAWNTNEPGAPAGSGSAGDAPVSPLVSAGQSGVEPTTPATTPAPATTPTSPSMSSDPVPVATQPPRPQPTQPEVEPSASPSTVTPQPPVSTAPSPDPEPEPVSPALPDAGAPVEPEPVSAFNIELSFLDGQQGMSLSASVREAFVKAQAAWERVIIGDLPDVNLRARQACFAESGAYAEGTIDDLRIFVVVKAIDGRNGVLGAAAPCLARSDNGLPFAGYMEFDSADLDRFAEEGRLHEVIIHEMGHVLGIGSLWSHFDLLVDPSLGNTPLDTHFTGSRAIAAFDELGGQQYNGAKVPVENVGGQGTANGHWREDLLGNELMTSYMTNLEGVLSTITVGSLEDLGYEVDYAAADAYAWPPPDERRGGFSFLREGAGLEEASEPIHFGDDILDIPVRYVD